VRCGPLPRDLLGTEISAELACNPPRGRSASRTSAAQSNVQNSRKIPGIFQR
jgi:hypothetical protein